MAKIKDGLGPDHIVSEIDSGVPVGCIMMWATATAPDGWLLCDGGKGDGSGEGTIDTKHQDLIDLVGSKTPNMVGRFPLGAKASGLPEATTLKSAAGSAEIGQHTHTQSSHSHPTGVGWREANGMSSSHTFQGKHVYGHSTTGYGNLSTAGASPSQTVQNNSTTNTKSKNMPPYLALNFIIKT